MAKKSKIEKWKREHKAFLDPNFESTSIRGRKLRHKAVSYTHLTLPTNREV